MKKKSSHPSSTSIMLATYFSQQPATSISTTSYFFLLFSLILLFFSFFFFLLINWWQSALSKVMFELFGERLPTSGAEPDIASKGNTHYFLDSNCQDELWEEGVFYRFEGLESSRSKRHSLSFPLCARAKDLVVDLLRHSIEQNALSRSDSRRRKSILSFLNDWIFLFSLSLSAWLFVALFSDNNFLLSMRHNGAMFLS